MANFYDRGAGGGAALLHAAKGLNAIKSKCDNFDQQIGVDIVARAVQQPARTILRNAGLEGAIIIGKLLESDDINFGYDSAGDVYCDMVAAGTLVGFLLCQPTVGALALCGLTLQLLLLCGLCAPWRLVVGP